MKAAIEKGDLASLKSIHLHGNDIFSFKDEESNGNGLLHFAI